MRYPKFAWPRVAAWVLALAAACTGFHPIYEVDAFFQMQLGRAVLEHGSRLVPEPSAIAAFSEPCLALEWLWGVVLWSTLRWLGPDSLTWLTMLLAFAAVWVSHGYLRDRSSQFGLEEHPAALVVLTSLTAVAIASRVKARPQVLFMLLIPTALWLIARTVSARGPQPGEAPWRAPRVRLSLALVGLVVLWAQLHASFVLVPGIYLAIALQRHLDVGWERANLRADALTLLGLLLAQLTSAAGLGLLPYLLAHGGGDAAAHVREMSPMVFSTFSPFNRPHHTALFAVWALSLAGLFHAGRPRVGEALLTLGGLVLIWRVQRFVAAATLLSLPLARIGMRNLAGVWGDVTLARVRRPLAAVTFGLSLWALSATAQRQAQTRGPLAHAGWTAGAHPIAALAVLDPGPKNPPREVLTDYRSGPALSFWSEGRIRHYVDGRTPQYFDNTDFAVQRELFTSEEALGRGLLRYRPSAAVVRRTGSCVGFARHWDLVAIDPMYSTFMPPGSHPGLPTLFGLAACGERYVGAQACGDAVNTTASLTRAAAFAEPAFVTYLRAAYRLRCAADPGPALALRQGASAWGHRVALRRLQAEAAVRAGDAERARQVMGEALADGDVGVVQVVPSGFATVVGPGFARAALEQALRTMDDAAPAELRVRLALLCAAQGDLECARFQGLRAAVRGRTEVVPVLALLAAEHPREQVRRDAKAWLGVLQLEAEPSGPK